MSKDVTVKSNRRPGWFWADNRLIDVHADAIGAYGIAVYCVLARLSWDDEVKTTYRQISKNLKISHQTVSRAIAALIAADLITVESVSNGDGPTVITLRRMDPGPIGTTPGPVVATPGPIGTTPGPVVSPLQDYNKTNSKDSLPASQSGPEGEGKKKKQDPRFKIFLSIFVRLYRFMHDGTGYEFDGADGAQLKRYLKRHPKVTDAEFRRYLEFYRQSDGINPEARAAKVFTYLHEYHGGPLDKFKQPKNVTVLKPKNDGPVETAGERARRQAKGDFSPYPKAKPEDDLAWDAREKT